MVDDETPLDAEELMNLSDKIDTLPPEDAKWVSKLFQECMRARMHEAEIIANDELALQGSAPRQADCSNEELAQIVLDAAEWLKTLWNVGYMGASGFPSPPRSAFPMIEAEDILNSALFARIREGKRPLPFPPPTRHGSPWHDLLECSDEHEVNAEIVRDGKGYALGTIIEACPDWHIIEEIVPNKEYILQHRSKGPLFKLRFNPDGLSTLKREPPNWTRRILMKERGGVKSFTLEWPKSEGGTEMQLIPLRALSWERAESEAAHWIATKFPEMYGQIHFDRVE